MSGHADAAAELLSSMEDELFQGVEPDVSEDGGVIVDPEAVSRILGIEDLDVCLALAFTIGEIDPFYDPEIAVSGELMLVRYKIDVLDLPYVIESCLNYYPYDMGMHARLAMAPSENVAVTEASVLICFPIESLVRCTPSRIASS